MTHDRDDSQTLSQAMATPIHLYSTGRTTRLPDELVHEIIRFLIAPTYSRQYGYNKCVLYALCQLCLVNYSFYDISAPYLYSSIVVTDMVQLHALVITLDASVVLCSYTHSLSITDFTHFRDYTSVVIPWVSDLLNLVNPHLRRLSLCSDIRDLAPASPMKEALDRFTDLQEFVQCGVSSMIWSDWKNLRYLLLSWEPKVSPAFINAISLMPRLTHLGLQCWSHAYLINPPTLQPHPIIELSKAGRSLQNIILSFSPFPQNFIRFLLDEFARTPLREGLDVRYAALHVIDSSGSFWEADSDSFLAPCADLFDE